MEGIFTTMGELAPVGSSFLGMELELQLASMVPSQADSGFVPTTDGNSSNFLLGDIFYPSTAGGQIPVENVPETSTTRNIWADEQIFLSPPFSRGLDLDLLSWLPEFANLPTFLAPSSSDPFPAPNPTTLTQSSIPFQATPPTSTPRAEVSRP